MFQCGENCIEAIGQCCGCWLQYQRRFDLDDSIVSYRRDRIPAGSLPDFIWNDLLAAPRGENDVGRGSNHVLWRNNTVSGCLCFLRSGNTSSPPAISMSSETQPMPLMSGSSHSSK